MRGLFLDLSTYVGWAIFEQPMLIPRFGTHRLPKTEADDYAGRTLPLMEWLESTIMHHKIELIGFESPFIPMNPLARGDAVNTTQHVLRLQIALATIIETIAREYKIQCYEVASITAKKAMTGRARLKDKRIEMVDAARARGWSVLDDHQADALAVGIVVYDTIGTPVPLALV